ncbi:MAG: cytochrome bd-I oxidase subunit CydX [Legionellaceae bacterium]|nr:cytochrome bd-I oxidase subunit CydX [Legionellaceae bacterium]
MWYFSWILGTALACTFAILNALWFELRDEQDDSSR